jgi:hypothetical protein
VRPLLLTAETRAILTRIRTCVGTLLVFGMSPGEAWRLIKARVERRSTCPTYSSDGGEATTSAGNSTS